MRVRKITKKPVNASRRVAAKTRANKPATKRVFAEDEIIEDDVIDDDVVDGEGTDVVVDPAATDLLFEAEDVAELLAEVTGEVVEVAVDDEADTTVFTVGEEEFTVEPDGDEEVVESATKIRKKRPVKASKKVAARRRTIRR